MSQSPSPEPKLSEKFCDPQADLTIRSSDGVLFKFHKKHIEVYSGAFAGADRFASSPTELVDLTETSEVLEALLGLMSLQRRPDLTDLPFEVMAPLAEAVEKYQVFSAMPICEMSMRASIMEHPLEVLEYAVRHNYVETMDKAAYKSIGMRMDEIKKHLSPKVFVIWAQYYQFWMDVLTHAHTSVSPTSHTARSGEKYYKCEPCTEWALMVAVISHRLGARIEALKELNATFRRNLSITSHVDGSIRDWKDTVAMKLAEIPQFSTLQ